MHVPMSVCVCMCMCAARRRLRGIGCGSGRPKFRMRATKTLKRPHDSIRISHPPSLPLRFPSFVAHLNLRAHLPESSRVPPWRAKTFPSVSTRTLLTAIVCLHPLSHPFPSLLTARIFLLCFFAGMQFLF